MTQGLVARAEDWRWSSLADPPPADVPPRRSPVPLPSDWREMVARAEPAAELETVRRSVARGTPFGGARWVPLTARRLGLESTVKPRGRPRKSP